MAAVRCVCYDGSKVVSGAYDYMVKVWDPTTEECLHTLQGHTNRVYSLQVKSNSNSKLNNNHYLGAMMHYWNVNADKNNDVILLIVM